MKKVIVRTRYGERQNVELVFETDRECTQVESVSEYAAECILKFLNSDVEIVKENLCEHKNLRNDSSAYPDTANFVCTACRKRFVLESTDIRKALNLN